MYPPLESHYYDAASEHCHPTDHCKTKEYDIVYTVINVDQEEDTPV